MTTAADFALSPSGHLDTQHVGTSRQCRLEIVDDVRDGRLMHDGNAPHVCRHERSQLRKRASTHDNLIRIVAGNDETIGHRMTCAISAVTAVAALPVLTTVAVATSS